MDGMLLIDKPLDWTSQDVCNKVKRTLRIKKVGHCGTLDPFASGLMIVLCGNATKLLSYILTLDKKYIATLKLGIETDTLDTEGEIIKEEEVKKYTLDEINNVLDSFKGRQNQTPPKYSALKIDGRPAYEYARKGVDVNLNSRPINIYDAKLIKYDEKNDEITFSCHVSKGTYVRTLGLDIAKKLKTIGHLNYLRRTYIGKYSVEDALSIDNIDPRYMIDINDCLDFFPSYVIPEREKFLVINGQRIQILNRKEKQIAIYDSNHILLAIYEKENNDTYYCLRGINNGNNKPKRK